MLSAQNVDSATLVHPPADSWPGYHGDYSGRRHSSLTQITPANVKSLSMAWAFQTNQTISIKGTPIVADGVMYLTVPDQRWANTMRAPAASFGTTNIRPTKGEHIGQRRGGNL